MAIEDNREDMVKFIHDCQRLFCSYDGFGYGKGSEQFRERKPPSMCDCKFGAAKIGNWGETGNGCPEMRCVHSILKHMTDKEFERIKKRIHKKAVKASKKMRKEWKYDVLPVPHPPAGPKPV